MAVLLGAINSSKSGFKIGKFVFKTDAQDFVESVKRNGGQAKIIKSSTKKLETIVKYKR